MFGGIIQNEGLVVEKHRRSGGQVRFVFEFKNKERRLALGESIAVNGVCLTVTEIFPKGFAVDVIPETLQSTNLKSLQSGQYVNLERSLKWGDRLSGHFVTGHVDGCGTIREIKKRGKNRLMMIRPPQKIHNLLAQKGSIAVDGISLTIQSLTAKDFGVALIPHTLEETALKRKTQGDLVNLEIDLITRYLAAIPSPYPSPHRGEGSPPKSTADPTRSLAEVRGISKKFNLAYLKKQGF